MADKKVLDGPYIRVTGSNGAEYRVYALGTAQQWCTCPAYRFETKAVAQRDCKHTLRLKLAGVTMSGN